VLWQFWQLFCCEAAKHLIEFIVVESSFRLPCQATRQSAVHAAKEALDHVG
jgi:hypothetical protein